MTGQGVTVSYSVTPTTGSTPTAPTGNVTVSDGTDSGTGTVAAGQCTITFGSAGSKSLTATYAGDANFNAGPASSSAAHTVNKAATSASITSDAPDPSPLNTAVAVHYSVTVDSPGSGTPTGNVTVSDSVDSCTATVAAGQCSITLTTIGSRNLTATYAGNTNFNSDVSPNEPHTVSGPTAVTLAAFGTAAARKGVVLRWRTASDAGIAGFVLERRSAGAGRFTRLSWLIPARGRLGGARYAHLDRTVRGGRTYIYRLTARSTTGKAVAVRTIAVRIR